jgi:hypothetical protein
VTQSGILKGSPVHEAHPLPDAALDADITILGKKGRGKTAAS